MATISSFSRRVYLASRYHHSALRLSPSRRLQATVTSVQPSYSQSPPPPSYAANTSHQAPKGKEFNASVSAGHTALRVPERRAEWGGMGEVDPSKRYEEMVSTGILRPDVHQEAIISHLQSLHGELRMYEQPLIEQMPQAAPSLFQRLLGSHTDTLPSPPANLPKSLYLYGDVGTGKTMMMDLFFSTLPSHVHRKRRVHFHAFMIDVHKRLHAYKTAHPHDGDDPILPIARDLAREAEVVCFDEFQVTDIADAMILRRLLECLRAFGVVFVMTSNRHPTELYKNGIQRASFLPAIDLILQSFHVIDLDSGTDYRKIPRALSKVYFSPLTPENSQEVDKIFSALTTHDGPLLYDRELIIWGRHLKIPESTENVAKFTFMDLCGKPLSAADYLEVTKKFGTVFVLGVPKMGLGQKDLARRFITFIDACYENHTKLFVSSEVPVYQVFSDAKPADHEHEKTAHIRSVMDDLGISDKEIGTTSIFTGEEEIFAFARACSRLIQMGTQEWAATAGHEDKHAMIL